MFPGGPAAERAIHLQHAAPGSNTTEKAQDKILNIDMNTQTRKQCGYSLIM